MMRTKMVLWTWLLFLVAFVSRGEAGECLKPELKGNVVFTDSALLQNNFPNGSDVTLECAIGYEVANGSDTITCLNGKWSDQKLICKKKDCGLPSTTPNLKYDTRDGTLFGAYIKPICDRGYYLQGSSYRQCLATGWTGRSKCLLVTCGKIPEIPHSIIVSKPEKEILEFNDVIEYSCEDAFTLEGNRSVVCQQNRKYSSLPQCKNKCSEPKLEGNVVFTDSGLLQNDFPHGSKVTLECATGYEVANGSDTITCLNGEWSMQELICKMVPCGKLPEIPHSIIVSQPEKEIFEFKDVIEYSCEDTYTLEGNRSVVCQENGKYSSFPQCKVTLECVVGYEVAKGSDTITCLNGKWSDQELICKKIEGSGSLKYLQDHLNAGIGIITIIVIVIFGILLGRYIYQKRKGSYDTGEDKREKDAFIQQKSFNLIQSQYKGL